MANGVVILYAGIAGWAGGDVALNVAAWRLGTVDALAVAHHICTLRTCTRNVDNVTPSCEHAVDFEANSWSADISPCICIYRLGQGSVRARAGKGADPHRDLALAWPGS